MPLELNLLQTTVSTESTYSWFCLDVADGSSFPMQRTDPIKQRLP